MGPSRASPRAQKPTRLRHPGEATEDAQATRRVRKRRVADDFFDVTNEEYHEPGYGKSMRFGHNSSMESSTPSSDPIFQAKRMKLESSDASSAAAFDDDDENSADQDGDSDVEDGSLQLKVKCNCRIRLPDDYVEKVALAISEHSPISVMACTSCRDEINGA